MVAKTLGYSDDAIDITADVINILVRCSLISIEEV